MPGYLEWNVRLDRRGRIDRRVCSRCRALNGVRVREGQQFPGTNVEEPPLHDGCRCRVREVEVWVDNPVIPVPVPVRVGGFAVGAAGVQAVREASRG